jgi:addiction module HigA family antidote
MIRSFADSETERFYTRGKTRRLPPEIRMRAAMRLIQLNAASRIQDLRLPPSNRLEALEDDRAGQWSIRVNDQWRVCFRFENGDAFAVEIVDYHWVEDIMVKNGLPPVHPGEFLRETLEELHVSQAAFARAIGVSAMRISHVARGARPVTAELALLFGRALGQSPQYWLSLQAAFDLRTAELTIGKRLKGVAELAHAWVLH